MLKRCQILLTDWLFDHLQIIAKKNDLSLSEMVRILLCEGLLHSSTILHPEYKKFDAKKLAVLTKEGVGADSRAIKHKLISDLYFEARKLTEYLNSKLDDNDK